MADRKRQIWSLRAELLIKSREAALTAIRIFNDPHVSFKSETFIVLMVIAWTYLLHAYYRSKRIEYRYSRPGPKRRIFDRTTKGAYKYWDLDRCLNEQRCPIDKDTSNNLRFLIGLRNQIEHQMTRSLDDHLSARYQACAFNYNDYIKELFGKRYALDTHLTYSIQFLELTEEQLGKPRQESEIPKRLRVYITDFDGALTHEEYNNPRYAYRLLFKKKIVNRPGQADKVIEFIDPNSNLAKDIDKSYWVKKEVERTKYRAKNVIEAAAEAGFPGFRLSPEHTDLWHAEDAKDPAKGYGTDIRGTWYWYEPWVSHVIEYCKAAGDKYRNPKEPKKNYR